MMKKEHSPDGFGMTQAETKAEAAKTPARSKLPLQLRTAYAVGGLSACEMVAIVTNFSSTAIPVEIEFFTGFNALARGIATLTLKPGETGTLATASPIPDFQINAVRDTTTPFAGYAQIHAPTSEIGVQVNGIGRVGTSNQSAVGIKVFRPPFQQGD